MIDLHKMEQTLRKLSVTFISGVPDTLLNDFCLHVENNWDKNNHIIAASEGNAVALAAGHQMATGDVPLVYMQNSGIGNAMNPLISLTHPSVYGVPMILLIGWRGNPEVKDHPQHTKQGILTPILMEDVDIPWRKLSNSEDGVETDLTWAVETAKANSSPVALIVPKGVLERGEKSGFEDDLKLMSREEAINVLVKEMPSDSIFVASTGRATRELYEVRRLRGEVHSNDFLNVGAMGHTSSIAAGFAIGRPERLVVCIDGDAAALMHLGAFPVNAQLKQCKKLLHVVLNNGVHESVGGQNSATAKISLHEIAKTSGYTVGDKQITSAEELVAEIEFIKNNVGQGPYFIEVIIRKGMRPDMPVLKFDLQEHRQAFLS